MNRDDYVIYGYLKIDHLSLDDFSEHTPAYLLTDFSIMSIPQALVDELLAKCGRRCCICRRFQPLYLQVHHIIPESEGGTNESDNLITVCLTCHADVHTQTSLTRRFTITELKMHRDHLIEQVAKGILLSESCINDDQLIAPIIEIIRDSEIQDYEIPHLSSAALELLLNAVKEENSGTIFDSSEIFTTSTTLTDARQQAKLKHAIDELENNNLIAYVKGILYRVTHEGFLIADQILSAGQ